MIRTLAAVAALAALPTLAVAQPAYDDDPGLTVYGQGPYSYSIVINVAGKDPLTVRDEISDAAYAACARAPLSGNAADFTIDATITCVNQARAGGLAQYDALLGGY